MTRCSMHERNEERMLRQTRSISSHSAFCCHALLSSVPARCLASPPCFGVVFSLSGASSGLCQPGAVGPIPNNPTCNDIISTGNPGLCQSNGPADNNPSYPTAGVVANVFLAVTSLFWLLRMVLYCCTRAWTPVLGLRLRAGLRVMVSGSAMNLRAHNAEESSAGCCPLLTLSRLLLLAPCCPAG